MDDDYEFADRPSAKERRSISWIPALLVLVRTQILKEITNDFVVVKNLANRLNVHSYQVGACLNALIHEGLVLPRCPVAPLDRDGDPVEIWLDGFTGHNPVRWNGKEWAHEQKSYKTSRKTGRVRHGTMKIEEIPVGDTWDGTGYYIIRDCEEFKKACRKEGLPEDPVLDPWTCRHCNQFNEGPGRHETCGKCYAHRFPREEKTIGEQKPKPSCPRCGSEIQFKSKRGRRLHPDHPLRQCNLALVRYVLET